MAGYGASPIRRSVSQAKPSTDRSQGSARTSAEISEARSRASARGCSAAFGRWSPSRGDRPGAGGARLPRVAAVELPGHGRSAADSEADIESFAGSLLESVPARPALAIGHSLGGSVGSSPTRLNPHQPRSLVCPRGHTGPTGVSRTRQNPAQPGRRDQPE